MNEKDSPLINWKPPTSPTCCCGPLNFFFEYLLWPFTTYGHFCTLCLAPDGWLAEYSKPLGAPVGPALQDGDVWTREFGNASHGCHVFVDLENRSKATITWKQ
jgi:hypothetical protein